MDPTAFDTLSRAFVRAGTRRRLVTLLAALPLGGVLTTLSDDEVAAERPHQRLGRRTKQRNRKQRTQNQNTSNNGGGKGSGGRLGQTDDACGGCPRGHGCCGTGPEAHCCPTDSTICCGGGRGCCPTDRAVCCGTGPEAHCCPIDSHYCWGTDPDAACLECPNGSCHVSNSAV